MEAVERDVKELANLNATVGDFLFYMPEDKKRTCKFNATVSTAVLRTWYNNDEFVGIDGRDVFCHIDPNMLIYSQVFL